MYMQRYACTYVHTYDVRIHTYYVLIRPDHTIYYVLAAVFASCFYVLFKFAYI